MTKTLLVCPFCGSENIRSTAVVEWHEHGQYWRIVEVLEDAAYCMAGDCLAEDFTPEERSN